MSEGRGPLVGPVEIVGVGLIGTSLGSASVNIANMALSRDPEHSRAVTVIEVDTEPPAALLASLRAAPGIIRVLSFEL